MKNPDPWPSLSGRLREYDQRLRRLETRSPFFDTGLYPDGAGGLTLQEVPLNPLVPAVVNVAASNFPVGTTYAELAGQDVTVPTGCSRLLATASGWVFAVNNNTTGGVDGTGTDALWCFVRVNGVDSGTHGHGVSGFGGFTTATSGLSVLAQGLTPGDTIRLGLYAAVSAQALPADVDNTATLSATLQWLR